MKRMSRTTNALFSTLCSCLSLSCSCQPDATSLSLYPSLASMIVAFSICAHSFISFLSHWFTELKSLRLLDLSPVSYSHLHSLIACTRHIHLSLLVVLLNECTCVYYLPTHSHMNLGEPIKRVVVRSWILIHGLQDQSPLLLRIYTFTDKCAYWLRS